MTPETIKALLQQAFPEAQIKVTGEGSKYDVTVVDAIFEGKRPVARQQAIYAPLNEHIISGAIHAVTIKTFTPEEWRKASLFGV